jgi:hypothetical protein
VDNVEEDLEGDGLEEVAALVHLSHVHPERIRPSLTSANFLFLFLINKSKILASNSAKCKQVLPNRRNLPAVSDQDAG